MDVAAVVAARLRLAPVENRAHHRRAKQNRTFFDCAHAAFNALLIC